MGLGFRVCGKKVFISYLNDDNKKIKGFFKLIEQTSEYIKIKSGSNILTIPFHRILKVKEKP